MGRLLRLEWYRVARSRALPVAVLAWMVAAAAALANGERAIERQRRALADQVVPTDRYSNAWYYAMQQRGDDAAAPAAAAYVATLHVRHAWVGRWLWLFPPAALQRALDRMARTDLPSHLAYLD
jgi:hypothetical protein